MRCSHSLPTAQCVSCVSSRQMSPMSRLVRLKTRVETYEPRFSKLRPRWLAGTHRLSAQTSGRPPFSSLEVRRSYANFTYQAGSWTKPRRVVAKVEWHPGELYPRVGFIVTNMVRPADNVVGFYNKRGTCEQWIREGKGAIRRTRLSCRPRFPDGGRRDFEKPLRRHPAAHRRVAATCHVNSMRRSVSRVRQKPRERCVLMTEISPLTGCDGEPKPPTRIGGLQRPFRLEKRLHRIRDWQATEWRI